MNKTRILLVEDHRITRLIFQSLLERKGYHVVVAADLAGAREAARQGFDLLISDLALPDGTGWELLTELSAIRPVKAIVISALGTEADIARSMAVGFLGHLVKPIVPRLLFEMIERVMADEEDFGLRMKRVG